MSDLLNSSSVLEVLRPVQDPELRKSLVELNMIRNVKLITVRLASPLC
jgi:ATP-binding protein involved in chromosome partitioning